jgi:enoyl-CoA hydratase/carnithine racemase
VASPFVGEQLAGDDAVSAVVVRGAASQLTSPVSLPVVLCWVGAQLGGDGPAAADVVLGEADVADLVTSVSVAPVAARTLAVLLRAQAQPELSVEVGLTLESAAYSLLQAGAEFATWRATAHHRPADDADRCVVDVERAGDTLAITLDRPHRHNAISAAVRDQLDEALALAETDASITRVVMRGRGPSFCSGGDLGEFGTRPDAATAHITRLARSPARRIDHLRDRTIVEVHGATLGGGLEMAAFAGHVVAHPATVFGLPEIGLGLIPGAGGTVSLTRRIGRQRTAALGLTGRSIDAPTALRWGLIDAVSESVGPLPGA